MTTKPILYSYWRSSCSWRVRIVLAWKRIEYDYVAVSLVKNGGENFSEDFTKLNPNQRVPSMVVDGHVLAQSSAIVEYLEETHTDRPLLPKDVYLRAQVRNICQIIGGDIQPVQNLAVLKKVAEGAADSEKDAKMMEWGKFWVERGFVALEQVLATTAGTYCVGDYVTLADVFLVPQVYNARRFGIDMSRFPTIARLDATLLELPEFKATHPSQQPDAE